MSASGPDEIPTHTIDYERYSLLSPPVRWDFDDWLARENLRDKHIVSLTLLEGAIEAYCYITECRDGHDGFAPTPLVDDTWPIEVKVFLIKTPPPREALT